MYANSSNSSSASNLKNFRLEPQKRSLNDDEEEASRSLQTSAQMSNLRLTMKTIITQW